MIFVEALGMGVLALVQFVLVEALNTTALLYLYRWFVVSALHTPDLSFWQMLGLSWFVQLLLRIPTQADFRSSDEVKHLEALFMAVAGGKRRELEEALIPSRTAPFTSGRWFGSRIGGSAFWLGAGWVLHRLLY